ncbi:MAG: ATP-binding protein [Hahellaceae bacterium]|nr:ATP-binding protein [Hahellaceae bacterium]MCP5170155.1 ATP-binding protein [Hahellaceae bacterium]
MPLQAASFPFTAVSGQPDFKLALILAAINPRVGGVLVSGPRGSAKSTLARGLADVLPASGESSVPFMTLPLGASEEMLVGTLNLQQVLQDQTVAFQPGLLAKAHGGVLYVDEVNLLADNLVDLLLDVSASGMNIIERDGISHRHPARFILLGTMNADEGELRPQLQDRFGLYVELGQAYSIAERIEIVRLREQFDTDPAGFIAAYAAQQHNLQQRIHQARERLPEVRCADELRVLIAERCHAAEVDGLRADIVWLRAALAHAALEGRMEMQASDILALEPLVLGHRRKATRTPPPNPPSPPPFSRPQDKTETGNSSQAAGDWGSMAPVAQPTASQKRLSFSSESNKVTSALNSIHAALNPSVGKDKGRDSRGTRSGKRDSHTVDWFGSLIRQAGSWPLRALHFKKQKTGQSVLHLILLDTSASTLENRLFAHAKATVLQIAEQAYLNREQLTLLGFGNQQVTTLLPKKRAPKSLRRFLDSIAAGGGTPLREMLQQALSYQQVQQRQTPGLKIKTYLITDGRTAQPLHDVQLLGEVLVIDIENSAVKRGKARALATQLRAPYFSLPVLLAEQR